MTIQRELKAIHREILIQASKIDKLAAAIDKLESSATKTKTTKAAAKAKPVKKTSRAKATPRKAAALTDTDKVLNIIKKSHEPVDTKSLVKETGFNTKKIQNIVFKAFKSGQIKKAGRGRYSGADK